MVLSLHSRQDKSNYYLLPRGEEGGNALGGGRIELVETSSLPMGDSFFAEAFFLLEKKGRSRAGAVTALYALRAWFMRFKMYSCFIILTILTEFQTAGASPRPTGYQ